MIDAIIADHQELLRAGLVEVLSVVEGVEKVNPHVSVLSDGLSAGIPEVERIFKRRKTALQLLAEENAQVGCIKWLRAHGIVYRSVDVPVLLDAMRRLASGELSLQGPSSDMRRHKSDVA